jgi:hypothetical protein
MRPVENDPADWANHIAVWDGNPSLQPGPLDARAALIEITGPDRTTACSSTKLSPSACGLHAYIACGNHHATGIPVYMWAAHSEIIEDFFE